VRDEAHRFAVTYHRTLRGRERLRSVLDDIPGVGGERKRKLLRTFGSLKRVREAPIDAIAAIPGFSRRLAEEIHQRLSQPAAEPALAAGRGRLALIRRAAPAAADRAGPLDEGAESIDESCVDSSVPLD
jgi:excinuclease ABC subunit C